MAPTISYPLDAPHFATLRRVCGMSPGARERLFHIADMGSAHLRASLNAIASPSLAAQLVRDLLARAGMRDHAVTTQPMLITVWRNGMAPVAVPISSVPTLILALLDTLDLSEPQRPEAALRALREAGR